MKTAMQELIEYLNGDTYAGICDIRDRAEELFEKEKEQIIEARIDGDENYSLIGGKRYEYAEQYYNETYNQKQHIIDIMKADENDGLYNQNES